MKKLLIVLGILSIIVLSVIFGFARFRYISYKEIDIAIQEHNYNKHIQNIEQHFDIHQYGYYKEVKYKEEPHNIYLYQTVVRPGLRDYVNPFYHYKKHNVKTLVNDKKTQNEIAGERKTRYQINDQWFI